MMQGKYGIKHTFRMSNYETVVVEGELTFDMSSGDDMFDVARKNLDESLRPDLERVKACTNFSADETYVYEWLKQDA